MRCRNSTGAGCVLRFLSRSDIVTWPHGPYESDDWRSTRGRDKQRRAGATFWLGHIRRASGPAIINRRRLAKVPGASMGLSVNRSDKKDQIMPEQFAVELKGITKRYSGHTAVKDLDLRVPTGSVYGLLGPNGAGKTTTLRMIMNIIGPDAGEVSLLGQGGSGRDLSRRIGYLPEERGLYKKMKVLDLLVFLAQIKGVDRSQARRGSIAWLERLGLSDWMEKKIDDLSKGMQQKVQFISTMLHNPELVVLDEPFAGLDPVNTQVIKDIVVDLSERGTTTLFSTHIMEQAEKLCDSVCIIARGTKVVDGSLAEVKKGHRGRHVIVAVESGMDSFRRILDQPSTVAQADTYGQYAELELAEGADPQRLLKDLVEAGARVTRFEIAEPTLNKIFIDLVGSEAATSPAQEHVANA